MTNIVSIQNSLAAGELSPALYGRTDLEKWHSGTSTCRNFFVNYRGGVISRPGLAYVGMTKQQYPNPPRDIPFQFNLNQGYVLEFGNLYLRVKFRGAYITEANKTVTSVDSSAKFTTSSAHGYSVGDWVFDTGNTGFSGLTWIVNTVPTSTTFTVKSLFGTAIGTATSSGAGTVARIYTTASPYAVADLPYLKYTQSSDVMTLCCVNTATSTEYRPYQLVRNSNISWVFTPITFTANISAPTNVKAVANSVTTISTFYSYVVTAVDKDSGEESVASTPAAVENNDIALYSGSNTITWNQVTGASSYNIYRAPASYSVGTPSSSIFGFVGSALGPAFTDGNITPDFTTVPPVHTNPFARSPITQVVPTAPGTNYSDQTIGYTVTTSTGSGFSGRPVTGNGGLLGFVIDNPGEGYSPSDTIAFTDTGGGIATGTMTAASNPPDGGHVFINGTDLKFRQNSTAPAYHEIVLGNTGALTLQSLANYCNASAEVSLSCATYSVTGNVMTITYKTIGSVGNAFTLGTGGPSIVISGATLTGGGTVGSGATATLTVGAATGTYPGVVNYFQQRQVFASTINQPDTYFMSQPGLFTNMDSSIPVTDADAITGTPWATQVNGIQFLQPMPGGLVVLTGKGAWQVNGGSQAAITPSDQTAIPQAYNGHNALVGPIPINYDILYVQAKGSIVRDLAYNFFTNIYTGTDMTVLSNHLFLGKTIVQWAYAEEPYKLVWVVLNDGTMLALTYLKEQDVYAWTRHDTDGLFVSVTTVTEPPVDAIYVITQRMIGGQWYYYSERMDNRIWANVEDSFCVDSGLTTALTEPNATLSVPLASGTQVTITADQPVFSMSMVNQILRVGGGKAVITAFINTQTLIINILETITTVVDDNVVPLPAPAPPGTWSIAPQITTITNLNHLEGKTVAILADGSVVPDQVVTNGTVTIGTPIPTYPEPIAASLVTVGLPYTCQAQTLYVEHPEGGNTTQNRRKTISAVGLRVEQSRGLQVGADQPDQATQPNEASPDWEDMNEIKVRNETDFLGHPVQLYTGDWYKAITSSWSVKGQVAIQQPYPLPASILSVITYWDVGDDK